MGDKVCLVFERNNENFLPKELHMELKKLLIIYLDALRFKEETFMNIIKMLNNCIQTTINKSERVEIISKANVRHLFIELMSTKRYVKPFLHCILTVMNNEEVLEFQDL